MEAQSGVERVAWHEDLMKLVEILEGLGATGEVVLKVAAVRMRITNGIVKVYASLVVAMYTE